MNTPTQVEIIPFLEKGRFYYLSKFIFHRLGSDADSLVLNLQLVLAVLDGNLVDYVQLQFDDIRDLVISDIDAHAEVMVSIENIKNRQMEGISFQVSELGNEVFSFYCRSYSIELQPIF